MSRERISSKSDIHASIDARDVYEKGLPGKRVSHFMSGKGHLLNSLTLTSLILVAMVVTFSIISPHFLSKANIYNILEQNVVFGPQRCMFGSDWPVCLLAGTYDDVVGALQQNLSDLNPQELEDVFRGTASRFYRI